MIRFEPMKYWFTNVIICTERGNNLYERFHQQCIFFVTMTLMFLIDRTEIDQKDMLTSEFITCSVLGADILDFSVSFR